jgi:hypothetical protein
VVAKRRYVCKFDVLTDLLFFREKVAPSWLVFIDIELLFTQILDCLHDVSWVIEQIDDHVSCVQLFINAEQTFVTSKVIKSGL